MTEPEDFDEDIFADLYENDDVPQKPAATSPPPTETAKANLNPNDSVAQDSSASPSANPPEANANYSANESSRGNNNTAIVTDSAQPQMSAPNEHGFTGVVGIKEDGKMFIGGLNWETDDQSLRNYFEQFGEVLECTVMRDGATGRSRGFGFLTFKDPRTVNTVMVKEHILDGKIIDPKRAIPRDEQEKTSKIFVGGVSQEATERDFEAYFAQFGRVIDATLMMDKDTGRPRGFGFVTFEGEAAVEATLAQPLEILGKPIEVKRAQPRGNIREEQEESGRGKFGRKGRDDRFQRNQQDNQGANDNNQVQNQQDNQAANNTMSPQMMAQYWTRMQQYFAVMQQQMAANMGQGQGMGAGGMNMQQQQAMMAAMMNNNMNQNGSPGPQAGQQNAGNMNPALMQQMMQQQQQQQQMQMQNQAQGGPDMQRMMSPSGGGDPNAGANRPGFNAQEQLDFERRKYEAQQTRGMGGGVSGRGGAGGQYPRQGYGGGGPTSWEGMYDDVPQPNLGGQAGRGGRNRGNQSNQGSQGTSGSPQPSPNAQAPPNAPTGPKNAGRPGANYRGGGRGSHRGYHPYARN